MEIFYTVQGEGAWTGHAAHFIRLAGCDVGCVWCDVKDSWDAGSYPRRTAEEIVASLAPGDCRKVVITGGEPAMYDLTDLTQCLKRSGYSVHLETSGTWPLQGQFDWVCFSPKKFKKPLEGFGQLADELKVIVFNASDFQWAEQFKATVRPDCRLFLQAEWEQREKIYPLLTGYVLNHPEWQISLQTHKYLQIP